MHARSTTLTLAVLFAAVAGPVAADGSAGAAPARSHSPAAPSVSAAVAADYAKQAFRATNRQRHHHDVRRLKRGVCLTRFARAQAQAMAAARRIFDQPLRPIQRGCGLDRVGENVAYGFPSGREVVNNGWMRSPGHRANILSPGYRRMGVASVQGSPGVWYVAQVFGR